MKNPKTRKPAKPPKTQSTSRTAPALNNGSRPRRSEHASASAARDPEAFIPDPGKTHRPVADDLAEYLGESFVESATTGDDVATEAQDELVPEEVGGPFIRLGPRAKFPEDINQAVMDAQMDDEPADAQMDDEPADVDVATPTPIRR